MSTRRDIYFRSHTVRIEEKEQKPRSRRRENEPKWPEHILVLDCECRLSADQTLTFGFWRFCKLRSGEYACLEEGIFFDQNLKTREMNVLRDYVRANNPETENDGSGRLRLYFRAKFIHEVLGMAVQANAMIVGFNLPFDLSRLAVDWECAENGGWSLIMSQWWNRQTGELTPNKFFPRIVVKALNSKTAMMHTTRAPMSERGEEQKKVKLWPAARFLDVRTLLWALSNRAYSLRTACKDLGVPGKLDHKPSGRVDLDEIEYCRQDVRATMGLLNAAKKEFDLHPIDLGPDRVFSPASIAKAYLEKLNILYPSEKLGS